MDRRDRRIDRRPPPIKKPRSQERKPREKAPAPRRERRHRTPRQQAESRNRFLLVGAVIAVMVVALGVIGFGYWDTNIRPKGETVLQVGDRSFSLSYMERRIQYSVAQTGYELPDNLTNAQLQQLVGSLVDQLITSVEDEELTRQGAHEMGIGATEEEIDNEIAQSQGLGADADPEEFRTAYREAVRSSGLSTEDFRDIMEASVLETKIRDKFLEEAPDSAEQVQFQLILVATEEEAQSVIDRLDAGEDFGDLAKELSLDTATKDQGGVRDWTPLRTLLDEVQEAILPLDIGERSEPILIPQGYLILEPLEEPTERETTDDQKAALANRTFFDWQDEIRSRVGVVNSLNADQTLTLLQKWVDESRRLPSG